MARARRDGPRGMPDGNGGAFARQGRRLLAATVVATMLVGTVDAFARNDDSCDKFVGGINPTNTAVLEDDFCAMSTTTTSFGGVEAWAPPTPLEQIGADVARQFGSGQGVVVAVLDGGFNLNHTDLVGHLSPIRFDAIDGDDDPNDLTPGAGAGHGTFIAGMVLEVAPDATVMAVRVRDNDGFGTNDEVATGFEFALEHGATVINLSLDSALAKRDRLLSLVRRAEYEGVQVVVASGNDGADRLTDLARTNGVIAVGAVDAMDRIADFSNYTTGWHRSTQVFAPGVDLYGPLGTAGDDSWGIWSGTSFSAGLVSGGVALLRSAHPEWTPADVRDALAETTDPVFLFDGTMLPSTGRIDLGRAVQR